MKPVRISRTGDSVEIRVVHRLSIEDFVKSVITSAIESGNYGIAYWANVDSISKGTSSDYSEVKLKYDLRDKPEGNREGRFTLGVEQIGEGIRLIMTGDPKQLGLHESNIGRVAAAVSAKDAGQIDGDAADWIVQVAIFGEVVFG